MIDQESPFVYHVEYCQSFCSLLSFFRLSLSHFCSFLSNILSLDISSSGAKNKAVGTGLSKVPSGFREFLKKGLKI